MTKLRVNLGAAVKLGACLALLVACTAGCDPPEARFHANMVYVRVQEELGESFQPEQTQAVVDAVTALFGTPDEPFVVPGSGLEQVVNESRLRRSAGKVRRDQNGVTVTGLYREHCVHCHGISGDGAGPTAAFLNPYPRDYRHGKFKFKTTIRNTSEDAKPTHEDLRKILIDGIPGTAMPSFKLLSNDEIDSLVDYVKYLSIRGELERALIYELSLEPEIEMTRSFLVDDQLARIVGRWQDAEGKVTQVPPHPDVDPEESIARGRQLFFGSVANCIKCHGDTQLGDGETTDYDDWTKDWYKGKVLEDEELKEQYLERGALKPRNILPRNLRQGIYRGGRRPVDIYLRIVNGIPGSPMPAVAVRAENAPPGDRSLTSDEIWNLVDYVLSLPYEDLSRPPNQRRVQGRERL